MKIGCKKIDFKRPSRKFSTEDMVNVKRPVQKQTGAFQSRKISMGKIWKSK